MNTSPDIAYAVNFVSQFGNKFNYTHWNVVKKIVKYLKATINCGIVYNKTENSDSQLMVYTDADFGEDLDTRKSRSGCRL